jgi:protein ERP2
MLSPAIRCTIGADFSLTLDIAPRRRECLHQNIEQGTEYEVEYQVIDGGELDINFIVQTPSGMLIVPDIRKTGDLHKLKASETGDYSFCFDNSFSHFSNKVVFFDLYIATDDDNGDVDKMFAALPDDTDYEVKLDDFKDTVDKIRDNLQKSTQTQKLFAAVESRDRSILETNFERVNFWSAVQLVAMVVAAFVNVIVIRGLFSDKQHTVSSTRLRT